MYLVRMNSVAAYVHQKCLTDFPPRAPYLEHLVSNQQQILAFWVVAQGRFYHTITID